MKPWEIASHYHERTKHHFRRYARSAGHLDWDNQPDPFRRFDSAPLIPLLFSSEDQSPAYDDLYVPGAVAAKPVCLQSISEFFELSLAISAWKELGGSRWALRINPSSGNLHPTEGYMLIGPVDGLHDSPGVYHYAPKEHGLERRAEFSLGAWRRLVDGFPDGTFFVGLSSIYWREAWKYGERAFRYCQHDVGHALAALTVSAAVQGWVVRLLDALSDAEIAALLGLDRSQDFGEAEREHPELLAAVVTSSTHTDTLVGDSKLAPALPSRLPVERSPSAGESRCAGAIAGVASGTWTGLANRLSSEYVDWEIIDAVADACAKPIQHGGWTDSSRAGVSAGGGPGVPAGQTTWQPGVGQASPTAGGIAHRTAQRDLLETSLGPDQSAVGARKIIRQRRSALALDGKTGIPAGRFFSLLDRVLPHMERIPWSALGPPVCVHLGLFVHLVEEIPQGLYCLVRSPDRLANLRKAMRSSFAWEKPPGCPDSLPLFILATGDYRATAWKVSCEQQIGGAGAFSLGMIAEFEPRLREYGGWFYRRLFWETGVIGQILYLEAESAGIRGTGIGCFFDDPVHEIFGLTGNAYQTLYHFTMGGPVEDTRLTGLPPYPR